MSEVAKLIIGLVSIIVGFLGGLAVHVFVMQRSGGVLFDRPGVGLLVAFGLSVGGAVLMGYLGLTIAGRIDARRKKAARKQKKKRK